MLVLWLRNSVTPEALVMAAEAMTTLDGDTVDARIPSLFRGADVMITFCGWPEKAAGAMQALFNTKDTGSGLGAGTILGGCLCLTPVKDTGVGCIKVK